MFKGISKMLSRPGGGEWILKRQKITPFLSFYTTLPLYMKDNDFWAQFWPKQLNNQYFILFNCLYWPKFSLSASCGRGFAGTLWKAKTTIESNRGSKIIWKRDSLICLQKKPVAQSARGCGGIGEKSDHPADLVDHPAAKLVLQIISQNWLSSCIWWSTNIFTRLCHGSATPSRGWNWFP